VSKPSSDRESPAWYETYFGPDYLRIYRLADTQDQLDFLRHVLPSRPGTRVLDVCCGHGRHAVVLAGWGYGVVGLDLSAPFLKVAQATAQGHGLPLPLVRGDVRAFPFQAGIFDVALSMFTSFGYFDDDRENELVLHQIAATLKPGALFILDLANPDFVRHQPPTSSWEHEGVKVSTVYAFNETTRRATTRRTVQFPEGQEKVYESSVRMYERDEIVSLVEAAGFTVQTLYGSYDRAPIDPSRKRMILVSERRSDGVGG